MDLSDLIAPDRVLGGCKAASKKQALLELSTVAAGHTGLSERVIFEALMERERLGTTGVGQGIAIPHAKLAQLTSLCGFFSRMASPIDFEAIDDQPVDLIFLLLAPETAGAEHLKALAQISRLLRKRSVCDKLRAATDAAALFALLTQPASHAA
ncbi:MAG: PTS IIA-like nitrogen regulatory protein PtsN [Alphaproteobacteria bacterium]